jgi:hypothetical protein
MLNNCVGKDNRAFVIAYLLSTSVLLFCIVLSALFHWTQVIPEAEKSASMRAQETPEEEQRYRY